MLSRPRATVLVVLYALACAAIIAPVAVWSRSYSYIAGNLLGSLVIWGVVAAAIAWVFALFFRAGQRTVRARAAFNLLLFSVATLMVVARVATFTH